MRQLSFPVIPSIYQNGLQAGLQQFFPMVSIEKIYHNFFHPTILQACLWTMTKNGAEPLLLRLWTIAIIDANSYTSYLVQVL